MSITLDDVLHDYSNDKTLISGMKQGDNMISKYAYLYSFMGNDYYYDNHNRKIKKDIMNNLKIKHYIKIGEECPICYEAIYNRKNAFLTDCGHSFHYSCIINYDYKNSFVKNGVFCPICRQDMGNYNDLKDNYKYKTNEMDKLFDFEVNIKTKLPKICFNFYEYKYNPHFHRMNYKTCDYCQLW
jgi:hypothetical protein